MKTLAKGNAAEAAVLEAFIQRGYDVAVPFGEGQPYDLAAHLQGTTFLRVQCKNARAQKGCILFNSCCTDHGRGRLPYVGRADMFGVYFEPLRCVYLVPVVGVPEFVVSLRLEPTRNNQRVGVRFAADYEIDRWSKDALLEVAETAPHPAKTLIASAA